MKKFGILFLLSFLLFSFSACKHDKLNDSKDYGKLSLKFAAADRTISPIEWNISDATARTVVITDKNSGDVYTFKNANYYSSFDLPVGSYSIEVEAEIGNYWDYEDKRYPLHGSAECVVNKGEETEITVFLSLKKTEDGKGSFKYIITLLDDKILANVSGYEFADYKFDATLVPVAGGENVVISGIPQNNGSSVDITFYAGAVKSGYYYLSITYALKKSETEYYEPNVYPIMGDTLVEIVDGKSTMAKSGSEYLENLTTRNYYITNGETYSAGLLPESPAGIDSIFATLNENSDWQTANLYFKTSDNFTEDTLSWFENCFPKIVFEEIPVTSDTNKVINIYTGWDLSYKITDGKVYVSCNKAEINPYFYVVSKNNTPVVLDAQMLSANKSPKFIVEGTTLILENTNALNSVTLYGIDVESEFIPGTSVPLMQLSGEMGEPSFVLNLLNENIFNSATFFTNYEAGVLQLYPAVVGNSDVSISEIIPEFELSGAAAIEIADEGTTYQCLVDGTSLGDGFVYTWLLNGKQVKTTNDSDVADTFELNPATNFYVREGENNLLVYVAKDGVYKTKNLKITVSKPKIISALYQGRALFATDLNALTEETVVRTDLKCVSDNFIDFATDKKGNLYVSGVDANGAYIRKFSDINPGSSDEPVTVLSDSMQWKYKLYYDYNNDDLYYGYLASGTYDAIHIRKFTGVSTRSDFTSSTKVYEPYSTAFKLLSFDDFIVIPGVGNMKAYIISKTETDAYPKVYMIDNSNTPEIFEAIDLYTNEVTDEIYQNVISVSDIAYADGNVYALLMERGTSKTVGTETNYYGGYSRGGVVKIDVSTNQVVGTYGYHENKCVDYNNDGVYGSEGSFIPDSIMNNVFFGPSKFVAVLPKKLIITDDGGYYADYYKSKDVNRVVTFDLETATIAGITDLNEENELGVECYCYDNGNGSNFNYYTFLEVTN